MQKQVTWNTIKQKMNRNMDLQTRRQIKDHHHVITEYEFTNQNQPIFPFFSTRKNNLS